ncbi:MAG: MBL fold metallo-hydrolase [Proteobacteria bacterium]|nr:MBL fold metallo-hydrolase [Pseudomonadota bacterium]
MKIKMLGVGSAFTTQAYYQTNLLITAPSGKNLLVDCGSDVRFALAEAGVNGPDMAGKIDAVYISHLHADHVGGLEWLSFLTYFSPGRHHPAMFCEERTMHNLWERTLHGGLFCVQRKCMHLSDYFECYPVKENGSFTWEGLGFEMVCLPHVLGGYADHFSHGLRIFLPGASVPAVFMTTDTRFAPDLVLAAGSDAGLVFHDCETGPVESDVHAHYRELITLPPSFKEKTWLYHYQPDPPQDPRADGFAGFCVKGQEFDFTP